MSKDGEDIFGEELRSELISLGRKQGLNNPVLVVKEATSIGDNFMGDIFSVVCKDENDERKINLIVKCAPKNETFRRQVPIGKIYNREIFAYEIVFKEMIKIQKQHGITNIFSPFAEYYKVIESEGNETLIMKDMKAIGYKMQDRRKPLDYDHVLFVLRSYGKLHALSFAIKDQNPKKFKELAENLHENLFTGSQNQMDYYENIGNQVCNLLEESLKEKFRYYCGQLKYILKNDLSEKAAGKYAVIGHGDSWTNNFLFKYEDSGAPGKPTDIIMLDWQLSRVCSPVIDIFYFLYVCTDKEVRDEHYHSLINEYYNSLASFLRKVGSDPDLLFPRSVLDEHIKKFMGFGVFTAMSMLQVVLKDKTEIPDFKNMNEEEIKNIRVESAAVVSTTYKERINGVIQDAVKYGCIYFQ